MSGAGFNVPIFGSMANTPQLLMLMAAIYLMLFRGNRLTRQLVAAC